MRLPPLRLPQTGAAAAIALVIGAAIALAADNPDLAARLSPQMIQQVFPGAEQVAPAEGAPPALSVTIGGKLAGFIFSTYDIVRATGYTGAPLDMIGGMTVEGKITGAALIEEHESIVDRGVKREKLDDFIAGFAAATLQDWRSVVPDWVQGASVTARLLKDGMQSSSRKVFNAHVLAAGGRVVTEPALDRDSFTKHAFDELLAMGAIVHQQVPIADVLAAFTKAGGVGAKPDQALPADTTAAFLNLYLGLLSPPTIGVNLLGDERYNELANRQGPGGLIVWMANDGAFDRANTHHNKTATGFFFDTLRIVQDAKVIPFIEGMLRTVPIPEEETGAPIDRIEAAAIFLPPTAGLDPIKPWTLEVVVPGKAADGKVMAVALPVAYRLPAALILLPQVEEVPVPAWVQLWRERSGRIAVLGALLTVVTLVFVFQNMLVRYRGLYTGVRVAVLTFVLGWLGLYAGAQLSVVNVMSYLQAPFSHIPLTSFLLDPLLFILSVYVALSLFVLGRGVFCGWLCPFGALQELLNKAAVLLGVRQFTVPSGVQERLWALKYIAAAAALGLAFVSLDWSESAAEVEPFKTVITAHFAREWPYVVYAAVLLGAGLFVERFYCRFLCPLGGSLAVFGRVHMFTWLRRKPQCGTECRICEADCPIGAISPTGAINPNECLQCLDCQVDYYDERKCPPLIARRKRRDARAPLPA